MKRTVIAGWLALIGTLWIVAVGDWVNRHLVDAAWMMGFFMETLLTHLAALLLFFCGVLLLGFGLISLIVEYFRKD